MTNSNSNSNSNSNAVQHRIMTAFPNIANWKNCELVITNLVAFFQGEKIRVNDAWKTCKCHSSLIANVEGRKVLKILKTANVSVNFGNDAARGGAVGNYFKCSRKNSNAVAFFKSLLDEVKAK